MKWHEAHRARMAAKALAKHRKAVEREPILARARQMYIQQGKEVPAVLRP